MSEYETRLAYAQFQFHKGTIKTEIAEIDGQKTIKFQFHKGTIKTQDCC